ncbi:hypothetical protein ACFE04_018502 [Oxalis oulophora]
MTAVVKLYVDRISQPSRAIVIFCKINDIEFEEIRINLLERQHHSPEYLQVNPMGQVPAIVHAHFQLFESHAILIYLASAYPRVAHHWYPADLFKRAQIHSVLDWHHSNLRRGAAGYVRSSTLGPALGLTLNQNAADEAEQVLASSLSKIESFWLKETGCFLFGANQPSIADLSMVCEIMQFELLDEKDRTRILGPHKKVQKWIENTRDATKPHFDEVNEILPKVKAILQEMQLANEKV